MLNTEGLRETVVTGLTDALQCTVIRGNQTAKMPAFPFIAYNITTLCKSNNGTYGEWEDGISRLPCVQTWSITAHSNKYEEAVRLASKAQTWLKYSGKTYLNDNDVIVQSVGNVTDRSNILTNDYIYSLGFDCDFWLYDEVENSIEESGYIESADINIEE